MNTYRIIGTSREVDAIGAHEPFDIREQAESAKAAYDAVKIEAYADNREHVHIREIRVLTDEDSYGVLVEPRAYLPC